MVVTPCMNYRGGHSLHRRSPSQVTDERLPYGKQFSPEQVELGVALDLARTHDGDRAAFQLALRKAFFDKSGSTLANRNTLAMNAFLSMRAYELVGGGDAKQPFRLTQEGQALLKLSASPKKQLARFAEHIVTRLHGVQLLEVIDSLRARGVKVRVSTVADELLALGVDPGSTSGEHINPLRMWLERAELLKGWEIQDPALRHIGGAGIADITELAALHVRHRAFLLALATVTGGPPYNAADIRRLAEVQTQEVRFETKSFAKDVLERLEKEGWVVVGKTTGGRGAKSHEVTPTKRFVEVVRVPLATALVQQTHLQDPASLRRPIRDLLKDVRNTNLSNHKRGLALEGVCIQLVRLLGARFVDWRRRGDETQGAEVDVVAELVRGQYQLIQLQSKASKISGRDVVDREVGVAAGLKSNVLLLVSAREVSDAARRAAASHMQESGLAILFLDGSDLERLEAGGEMARLMEREWRRVTAVRSPRSRQRTANLQS
jgi:hypothetical protein